MVQRSPGRREFEAKMAPVGRRRSVLQGPMIVLMFGSADKVVYISLLIGAMDDDVLVIAVRFRAALKFNAAAGTPVDIMN